MQITVKTGAKTEFADITAQVRDAVRAAGIGAGLCMLFVPHTTAGITINESADPSVSEDILMALNKMVPWHDAYRHAEGNSAAHIKASLMGSSVTVAIQDGNLVLGTWQGVFICEFDGPRSRKVMIHLIPTTPDA
jgi:secondary thiamine-phosphate synthase enzyme